MCASQPMTPTTTSRSFAALVQRLAVARDPVQGPRARFERPGVHDADDGKKPGLKAAAGDDLEAVMERIENLKIHAQLPPPRPGAHEACPNSTAPRIRARQIRA